jgi:hypothetical protein
LNFDAHCACCQGLGAVADGFSVSIPAGPFRFCSGRLLIFAVSFLAGSFLEGVAVAIYQLIQTASFGPEDVTRLTTAYEDALRELQLSNRTDPITTIIAQRIIEAAKTGIRDPDQLCAFAIKDLRVP